jgi:predicted RNase H-like HicB family nuclease
MATKKVDTLYKYRMHLYWSEPDQAWIVAIPDLPGAMADGETPEAAVAMAQEVIALWIETARERGQPIPEPQAEPVVQ